MSKTAPKASVLIVDDETYVRDSLATLLGRRGYEIRTAGGYDEALRTESLEGVDAVVTDLKMPGRDGTELLAKLREIEPDLPVIVLTGHGTIPSAVDCLKAGAADYLLKPVEPDELTVVLERALGRRDMERELDFLRSEGGSPAARGGEGAQTTTAAGRERRLAPGAPDGGDGRRNRHGGAAPRRVRHRQGGGGEAHPPPQPPRRRALRAGQLRRHPERAVRERVLRPQARRLHRRHGRPGRALQGRPQGHPLPRRDQLPPRARPGEGAAGAPGRPLRAGRRQPADGGGRAPDLRQQLRPLRRGRVRRLPGRPLLPRSTS